MDTLRVAIPVPAGLVALEVDCEGDDIRSDGSVEIRANCLLMFEGNSYAIDMFGVVFGIASMLLRQSVSEVVKVSRR